MPRLDETRRKPFLERPSRGRGGCRRERNLHIAPLRRGDWGADFAAAILLSPIPLRGGVPSQRRGGLCGSRSDATRAFQLTSTNENAL